MRRDSRMPICVPVAAIRARFESRHALAEKTQQLHHLQARLDFGARQIVRIERIDVGDARHVDGHFVGIRRDEKRYQLARNVDDLLRLRLVPQVRTVPRRRSSAGAVRSCAFSDVRI